MNNLGSLGINEALRSLTASQQVQILFAVLFGLLILATIGLFLYTFKTSDEAEEDEQRAGLLRHTRRLLVTTWWMAIVFWVSWVLGDTAATLLFALVSFLALREFITLSPTRRGDHRSLVLAFFVVLPIQYWLVARHQVGLLTVFIPVYVFLAIPVVSALGKEPQKFLSRTSKLQWGIMVCVYGMSHVPALLILQYPGFEGKSAYLVFMLVMTVQTCMLVQHLVARRWPGAQIAPAISRSFQWRSWPAGLAAGGVLGGILAVFTPLNPARGLLMGLIACLAGSLGHFVMKAIKRDRGITNWGVDGRSTTGAGGLLDRVDALCFAAPVFFHALQWVLQNSR